jgi:hypothetical protein
MLVLDRRRRLPAAATPQPHTLKDLPPAAAAARRDGTSPWVEARTGIFFS